MEERIETTTTTAAARERVRERLDTSVTIKAAPETVWDHLVDAQHLGAWFAERVAIDPAPGGAFVFGGRYTPGAPVAVQGVIRRLRSSQELRFTWPIDGVESVVTMTLTASGGGTRVELMHHAFERIGVGAAKIYDEFAGGWDQRELLALKRVVDGRAG